MMMSDDVRVLTLVPAGSLSSSGQAVKMSKIKNFHFLSHDKTEAVMEAAVGSEFILIDYYFEASSGKTEGFLGSYWCLVITVMNKITQDVKSRRFFIKTTPYDPDQPSLADKTRQLFYKETNFYKKIVPELARHSDSWYPRCFLVTDEVLVFEDLKDRSFKTKRGILDASSLESALTSLARLHASSMLAEKRLGQTFSQLYPKVMEESLFTKKTRLYQWVLRGIDVVVALAKDRGFADTSRIPEACDLIFEALGESRKWRNVVCHGDAWTNNLMFDGSGCVLVDYQMVRYAPAMTDLVQLIYLTTRQSYRKEHELDLLNHYHEAFCKTLGQKTSFEELVQEFEELRIVGMITAMMYFPTPLASELLDEDFLKECNGLDTLLFEDRVDVVMRILNRYPEYNDRITEILFEFMEKVHELYSHSSDL